MDPYDSFTSSPTGLKVEGIKGERGWNREEEVFPPRSADSYRRRSPVAGSHERRRTSGRTRSRSPIAIDRYQPNDRDRDSSRDYPGRDREDRRRAPSPSAGNIDRYVPGQDSNGKPIVRTNPLPNPLSLDFQVGFNWFAEWWRAERSIKEDKERAKHGGRRPPERARGERDSREERDKERSEIQAAYDAYKVELQVKLARFFVQLHRGEEWFKERYVPEVRDPLRYRLIEFRKPAYDQWLQDIESGVFDEFTLEGIYKSESDGQGGIIEKEEGEATAVGETLSVLDLVPARGADLRDESLQQPALLIKTLAPNVSREKIEEFCKENLGEGEGGFKWLSLSDPNPGKKCHRMGWIMLHPGPETPEVVERGDGREEEGEEIENSPSTGAGKPSTAEKALEAVNGKTIQDPVRGDFICHVGVHVPPSHPRKKALWDLFSAPERIDRDLELAKRIVAKFDSELLSSAEGSKKIEERVEDLRSKGWLQPPVTGPVKARKNKTSESDIDMIPLEDEAEEGEEIQEDEYDEEVESEDLLIKKKYLDLLVEYLRRVYNFCFFCVFESDSVHELTRKCPGGHLRRPRSGLSSQAKAVAKASALGQPFPSSKNKESSEESATTFTSTADAEASEEKKAPRYASKNEQQLQRAFNWVKTFEDKLLQILEPENVDLKKLGGRPIEQGVEEEVTKFVKQEDESKFRCKVPECTKLFKAYHFWRKHVEKRHPEWFNEIRNELVLVNSYVLDPSHISPSRPDAASNGHFPFAPGQLPSGTPRGFNLANMPFGFGGNPVGMPGAGPSFHGLPPTGAGIPGFSNTTGGWTGAGIAINGGSGVGGDPSALHHPGVIRRGGRMMGMRQGPYDRRGGRSGPMGGVGRGGPAGRFGIGGGMMGAGAGRFGTQPGVPYIPPGHPAALAAGLGGPAAFGAGVARWGDNLGGNPQAMGPKEAVQGRSLKSYEDLDAVGGQGSGELNY